MRCTANFQRPYTSERSCIMQAYTARSNVNVFSNHPADSTAPKLLVYHGEGAGQRSALSAHEALSASLAGRPAQVSFIGPSELLEGRWAQPGSGVLLLCMPGGADLPYCRTLNGAGNKLIRGFVERGGAYLGLCAGAYYATSRVVFEPGSALEVVGDRELALFPGHAYGAAYPGFDYASERGAVAAPLRFRSNYTLQPCGQLARALASAAAAPSTSPAHVISSGQSSSSTHHTSATCTTSSTASTSSPSYSHTAVQLTQAGSAPSQHTYHSSLPSRPEPPGSSSTTTTSARLSAQCPCTQPHKHWCRHRGNKLGDL
mmetsp:Transcript_27249/g.59539  ORF Transcript_27249/g.59539 Transcript_27249/m.59539 type:complete len:316 (-) Transcript_27249:365-1312(-)